MKKMTIAWTITMILIFGSLTAFGLMYKSKRINSIMEESILNKTKEYTKKFSALLPVENETIKITVESLIEEGFNPQLEKGCRGYAIITQKDEEYSYKSFIKCPDYKTEGYEE